jgi:hypothetical protein
VPEVALTLIGKPECHLCDVATDVVVGVLEELESVPAAPAVALERLSILDDPALYARYWEQIPVLLLNGAEHSHWHVDPARLRTAILEA